MMPLTCMCETARGRLGLKVYGDRYDNNYGS
jgi:hypothetical protein